MAAFLSRRWRHRPSGVLLPDARFGVIGVCAPGLGLAMSAASPAVAVWRGGPGFVFTADASNVETRWLTGVRDVAGLSELSILVHRTAGTKTNYAFLGGATVQVTGTYYRRFAIADNNPYVTFRTRNTTTGDTGSGQDLSSGITKTAGALQTVVGTYSVSKTSKSIFINGVRAATTATGVTAMTSTASMHVGLGTPESTYATGSDESIHLMVIADHAWSDAEVGAIGENPWALFLRYEPKIYSLPYKFSRPAADVSNSGWVRVP